MYMYRHIYTHTHTHIYIMNALRQAENNDDTRWPEMTHCPDTPAVISHVTVLE